MNSITLFFFFFVFCGPYRNYKFVMEKVKNSVGGVGLFRKERIRRRQNQGGTSLKPNKVIKSVCCVFVSPVGGCDFAVYMHDNLKTKKGPGFKSPTPAAQDLSLWSLDVLIVFTRVLAPAHTQTLYSTPPRTNLPPLCPSCQFQSLKKYIFKTKQKKI